jgi:hypothetical protein
MAGELLDIADIVVEQEMGELVSNVAVRAAGLVEGVVHRDGPAVGQVEGDRGEGARLDAFEFLEPSGIDKLIGGTDLHVEVASQVTDVESVSGTETHVSPGSLSEPFGLGLESSSHLAY